MKFGVYLEQHIRDIWRSQYIRYQELKGLLYDVVETGANLVKPQTLSLTIRDAQQLSRTGGLHERFFMEIESQCSMVNNFVSAQAQLLRQQLRAIESRLQKITAPHRPPRLETITSLPARDALASPSRVGTASGGLSAALQAQQSIGAAGGVPGAGGSVSCPVSGGTSRRATPDKGDPAATLAASAISPQTGSPASGTHTGSIGAESAAQGGSGLSRQTVGVQSVTGGAGTSGGGVAALPLIQHDTLAQLQSDAQAVGREYLALEKYVNVNYAALQKILKKHDKLIPQAPCWAFFRLHTSKQPWIRGEHHDIQVALAKVFSKIHTALRTAAGTPAPPLARADESDPSRVPQYNVVEVARKFWVRIEDMAELEYNILQHLPVCGLSGRLPDHDTHSFTSSGLDRTHSGRPRAHTHSHSHIPQPRRSTGGMPSSHTGSHPGDDPHDRHTLQMGEVVNLLYLDNASLELYHNLLYGRPYAAEIRLRWVGDRLSPRDMVTLQRKVYREGWRPDTSVKDSFPLEEKRVAEYLAGRWTFADARDQLLLQAKQRSLSHTDTLTRHSTHTSTAASTSQAIPMSAQSNFTSPTPFASQAHAAFATGANANPSSFITSIGSLTHAGSLRTRAAALMQASAAMGGVGDSLAMNHLAQLAEEMEATQREYALFKTFTEVQRMVEVKALQPVVRVRMVQTVFEDPCVTAAEALQHAQDREGSAAAAGVVTRIQIDSQIRALLEYSTDGLTRLANNLWRQPRPADSVDFPYGCVTVIMACPEDTQSEDGGPGGAGERDSWWHPTHLPPWLQGMVDTNKLVEIQDFSKFLFATAGLLPDMVRAVPNWIDDPLLQKCLAAQVFDTAHWNAVKEAAMSAHSAAGGAGGAQRGSEPVFARTSSHRQPSIDGHSLSTSIKLSGSMGERFKPRNTTGTSPGPTGSAGLGGSGSALQAVATRRGSPGPGEYSAIYERIDSSRHAPPSTPGTAGRLPQILQQAGNKLSHEIKGWQVKLLARQQSRGRVYQPQALFMEPTTFLRSERVFLTWLTMSVTLSGLACGMLGFAAISARNPKAISLLHICEVTAFVQLGLALVMCAYAIIVFWWRNNSLYERRPHRVDDTRGSLLLCLLVALCLASLFTLNLYDLIQSLTSHGGKHRGDGYTTVLLSNSDHDRVTRVGLSEGGNGGGGVFVGGGGDNVEQGECGGCMPYWGQGGCGWADAEQREGGAVVRVAEAAACALVRGGSYLRNWLTHTHDRPP